MERDKAVADGNHVTSKSTSHSRRSSSERSQISNAIPTIAGTSKGRNVAEAEKAVTDMNDVQGLSNVGIRIRQRDYDYSE